MKNIISQDEKNAIDKLCRQFNVHNYKINNDRTIDVDGDVYIGLGHGHRDIPLKFNIVGGNFDCSNNAMTTLKGCPKYVGGNFNCSNNRLTSIKFSPRKVHGDFRCHSNRITSLVGGPKYVGGNYSAHTNDLSTLEGCAETINGDMYVIMNYHLKSTFSGIIDINLGNEISVGKNKLPSEMVDLDAHIMRIVLKYQRHFFIWNDDMTLDVKNFNDLLDEIKDGLL